MHDRARKHNELRDAFRKSVKIGGHKQAATTYNLSQIISDSVHRLGYMGLLLHGRNPPAFPMLSETVRQNLAAQNTPRTQRLARMKANLKEMTCGTVEVISGPPPLPKAIVKPLTDLRPDPVKSTRDATIGDTICRKYDAQHPPPVVTLDQLRAACQTAPK